MRIYLLILALCVALGGCSAKKWDSKDWISRPADQNRFHKFVVALKPNSEGVKKLEHLILNELSNIDSPNYGNYLTPEELNEMVASPAHVRKEILEWFVYQGVECKDHGDNLVCSTTVDNIDRLFKTSMMDHIHSKTGKNLHTSPKPYEIPPHLQSHILFIDGLSNRLPVYSKPKLNMESDNSVVDPGSVALEVMTRIYNLDSTLTGPGVSVGAMEYMDSQNSDGFNNKSMMVDQVANGVPKNPVSEEHLIGNNSSPSDGESDLDVQTMYWGASDATLWYETSDMWMYDWAVDFLNRKEVPEVVSISWGWDEMDQCSITQCNGTNSRQYLQMTNVQFAKIVARGVTIVVSSGDAGSPGRTNEVCESKQNGTYWNHINPVFPGGSPWVLSVGATYIVNPNKTYDRSPFVLSVGASQIVNKKVDFHTPICTSIKGVTCATGTEEQGTTQPMTGWTSGSGFDHWDPTPEWQSDEVRAYLSSGVELPDLRYFNPKGRAYPDIAGFGHNCITYSQYVGWQNADGTSCSSPIIAGGIANLNAFQKSRGKPTLGFVNPLLYKMGREMRSAFHDVTVGNSTCTEATCCGPQFGFVATKGWDPVSGLGTPDYGQMKKWLSAH